MNHQQLKFKHFKFRHFKAMSVPMQHQRSSSELITPEVFTTADEDAGV
eukprot:CAMPEP_0119110734 /NCGR_PEP_ID=MMETSP1180-20130426/31724_1 /TAXON_ID=3052 ORGANISM="Chlamydomonas cf sp, Strain CCMP681" /NCGR_SAMPLE_ID=MMETSP1180 /ASSEMBLY_ACC=CAM_ASM_000741 /LENGTH=47 /DNA_ID= /DNA_START= /DNA_END= /DNA_ORIENTATION=